MKLTRLYSVLIILNLIFGSSIKPENSNEIESIQIISKTNKKYTYYHLDNDGEIIFDNLERILRKDRNYIIKIMARTPISKNSNSNKAFGFNLNINHRGKNIISDDLKYKQRISKVLKADKKGMHFTDAGYWVEEIFSPNNLRIKVKSIKDSPDVYLKVSYEEIIPLETKKAIYPIQQKTYSTLYLDYENSPTKKSIKWYGIDENKVQYKIKGPKKIKVRTRSLIGLNNQEYKYYIYEDGYIKSEHVYNIKQPRNEVYILDDDNDKLQLSKQDYLLINVPKGDHYYSFKKSKQTPKVYIKLEPVYKGK